MHYSGISTLRHSVVSVVLDVLYYMSPSHKDMMLTALYTAINRIYSRFLIRNPGFEERGGKVSLIGHSLGSVVLFDLLCEHHVKVTLASHSPTRKVSKTQTLEEEFCRLE